MPDGTIGQTYDNTPAVPGKMLKPDDSILDVATLLSDMLAAMQNVSINIDSVNINTDEVESNLNQIRELTVDTNNLIAAGNALLTTIDADTDAIKTAVELIDDIVATPGSAFSGKVAAIGGPAESTVPTERADREGVEAWLNTFGQFVNPSHDLATGSDMITDASPAQMQKQFTTDSEWTALTTPGDVTATRSVRDYENLLISYTIAAIDTSVGLIIWGSFDGGTTFHPIWADTILAADDQDDTVSFVGIALTDVYCEFDAEVGGVAATVTFEMGASN